MTFPTAAELMAPAIVQRFGLADRVRVEHLGESRAGRPIPMLSIGDGRHSALIVGAPHPNEPTGCLTILRMLARLAAPDAVAPTPDWQWHFIPAVDIDGIALNERWFSGSPDIETYLEHFFRPPFRLQPEYSFPLELQRPAYQFTAGTPENACWQKALEITQPRLQCSLHGADTGGSFFILSDNAPALAGELAGLPSSFDISLNEIGEPFAEMAVHQPGVFAFPSVPDILARGVDAGVAPGSSWQAGDSSAGFAGQRYGTFSMTCEVPLWRDAREGDSAASGRTLVEVIDERIRQLREDVDMLSEWLPAVLPQADSLESASVAVALQDSLPAADGLITALEQTRQLGSDGRHLTVRELVWFEAGTVAMRVPALMLRLATLNGTAAAQTAARSLLQSRLAAHRRATRLSAVPLGQATDLQMAAVLAAARFLGADRTGASQRN